MSDTIPLETMRRKMQRRNHPAKGSAIKAEPIRDINTTMAIKQLLHNQPRNLCLFTLGINTAYRVGELLSLGISDVAHLEVGDIIDLKQGKNREYRMATLNGVSLNTIHHSPF